MSPVASSKERHSNKFQFAKERDCDMIIQGREQITEITVTTRKQ